MLDIDLLTTYVVCGAAACAAALMTALARADEACMAGALRRASAGFALLGVSLLQLVLGVAGPLDPRMLLALFGSTAGLGLVGWGMAQAVGQRLSGGWVAGLIMTVLGAQALSLALGALALSVAYSAGIALLCALTTWALRGCLLRPRHPTEAVLGWVMVGFVASYALRAALALTHDGPATVHHAYGPPAVLRALGILYGAMPVVVATLLLGMSNARLAARLAQHAVTDELTGAFNRRALREQAPALLEQHRREGRQTAVLLLDIDHFKQVNDRWGHPGGDAVLRELAQLLQTQAPAGSLLIRHGGEEFALLMPAASATAAADAAQAAEQLRMAAAQHRFAGSLAPLRISFSAGLALRHPAEELEAALRRADAALYRAKRAGRNRIEHAQPPEAAGSPAVATATIAEAA